MNPLRLTLVALLTLTLAGCSASNSAPPVARSLPPAPEFAQPVGVAQPRAGEPLVGIAARERAGRIGANRRITSFREWYEGVRKDYAR